VEVVVGAAVEDELDVDVVVKVTRVSWNNWVEALVGGAGLETFARALELTRETDTMGTEEPGGGGAGVVWTTPSGAVIITGPPYATFGAIPN